MPTRFGVQELASVGGSQEAIGNIEKPVGGMQERRDVSNGYERLDRREVPSIWGYEDVESAIQDGGIYERRHGLEAEGGEVPPPYEYRGYGAERLAVSDVKS